jgi:hypothetical protein
MKEKKLTRQGAISAFCKGCIYDDSFKGGGTWKQQVADCTVTHCALYQYRPVPKKYKEALIASQA